MVGCDSLALEQRHSLAANTYEFAEQLLADFLQFDEDIATMS